MAEKYRAKANNLNSEVNEKSEKELRRESGAKVAKVAAKGFVPGVGGKLVDMASKTKAGKQILNRAGNTLARNPIAGRVMKEADASGLVDAADSAVDLLGKNPSGLKDNTNTSLNNSNNNLKSENNSSHENSGFNLFNKKNDKNTSFFGSAFGGKVDLFKLVGKKYLIIGAASVFGLLMFMTIIASAKDFLNLDLTDKSSSSNVPSYTLGSINVVTPDAISNIDDSVIDGKNGAILSNGDTLNSLLGVDRLNTLNQSILESAQTVGYGTGAAPAAAAHALIENLLKNKIILPYFWGGGHSVISNGADGNWGTYTKVSVSGHSTSFSNQPLGLDCSGFVSWALYNGGCKNFAPITAADFKNLGVSESFNNAKTGDIAASDTHVVLILENRGENLLVAEAKGTAHGVVFSLKNESSLNGYSINDMSEYYKLNCS